MKAYKKRQVEALVLIQDGLVRVQDGIALLFEPEEPETQPKYALEKITWTQETGNKGPYEKAVEQDNVDFRGLVNDLEAHNGKLQLNGYFIWKFSQGNSIGRKLKNI
jgi:hypothetical protein